MAKERPDVQSVDEALNFAAGRLKQADVRIHEALSAVRQAQLLHKGIAVETIPTHSPQGGHSDTTEDTLETP